MTHSVSGRVEIEVHPDGAAAARAAADEFVRLARAAADEGRDFHAVLTGGDSPVELYALLGSDSVSRRVPWERVRLFWGDDRCVAPAHPRSNYGMARELFVARVPIPREKVHRIRGELRARRAADAYEAELRSLFGGDTPAFDLVHLGVGDDGHIASLFPFDLENLTERERWVKPALERELGEPRVTLTPRAIRSAGTVRMLMPSADEAEMARRLLEGPLDPFRLPAQMARPYRGMHVWTLTTGSAARLGASRP